MKCKVVCVSLQEQVPKMKLQDKGTQSMSNKKVN